MSYTCDHCHAKKSNLEWTTEILQNGATLQTVRCIRCGWRTSRTLEDASPLTLRPTRPRHSAENYRPCTVSGCVCNGILGSNPLGMCSRHWERLKFWRGSKKTKPAPLQLIAGVWTEVRAPRERRPSRCAARS